jgi:PPK2 family polyphosphate:nucleotide phosphotransferase
MAAPDTSTEEPLCSARCALRRHGAGSATSSALASPSVIEQLRVKPGERVRLPSRSTNETFGWNKEEAKAELSKVLQRINELQTLLFAEERRSLLVVLQAMDAAGKDGTIRSIFTSVNPAGVRITGFGVPTATELAHDYLWRVHAACPERGQIGVFNRSHYEDVLVVRVKNFVTRAVWSKRYGHIRNLEQALVDEGTTIIKIYLHVSKEEQALRLQDRIDDPSERWKFRLGDLDDRKLRPKFVAAYEDAFVETSTKKAPWYIVPADRKWARNLAANIVLKTLETMNPQLPPAEDGLEGLKVT